jgi:Bifunctional DNA primase/polymerase, N-terminal
MTTASPDAPLMALAALSYAAKGWRVFPCLPSGKQPLTLHGLKEATTDPEQIRAWWRKWPDANVAIATGAASGVFVVDLDYDHDGLDSLVQLEAGKPKGLVTLECATGGGGSHLYFTWPLGFEIRNSAGKLGKGIDIRGEGGYVVAPPSLHKSGQRYQWCTAYPEPIDPPSWLLSALTQPTDLQPRGSRPRLATAFVPKGQGGRYAQKALQNELDILQATPQGQRNDQLNRSAFSLGQLVGAGKLSAELVIDELLNAGLAIGLAENETRNTIKSGLAKGINHPREGA